MASPDRTTTYSLIEYLRTEPYRFEFFAALRLIECHHAHKPRLGTAVKAADDPIRLTQNISLDFAPSSLASYSERDEGLPHFGNFSPQERQDNTVIQAFLDRLPPRLAVSFLGLFGPNGALPLHLTEYALERMRERDFTFARFADVFHHRMLCLFYRAWANAQPTVNFDRPESDRFAAYIGSLLGIGVESLRDRDDMPDRAKLYFAGYLANPTRHPEGLRALIRGFFRLDVDIVEFIGEWMEIPVPDRTRLGSSKRVSTLGVSAVVGTRVWGCQHKFRIVLGPMSFTQYNDLLPGGKGLKTLVAIVRNYIGDEMVWDLDLILLRQEVPTLRLGEMQLGWTTWLGSRSGDADADDLRLNPATAWADVKQSDRRLFD